MLSTHSLVDSRLVPDDDDIEDSVSGALNRKHPRSGSVKGVYNKEAHPAKRPETVGKISPLKTLPPSPLKVGEASRATGGADPTTSLPPT